ncbi:NAD(P)-binding domain-containing protein [Chitinophagaceae bacterium LB-8]|uniref:NAD(P)-binding domain-containing protein n=1 Tax=Paraflavisolibacter caeni TaxID=2982496 RepID=A0A9X2XST3_9BACT|nr:NAD(P)-binding domain-containing protein [Paraflavisolibacter caeni]MCU7547606.1 NAD(P)-binding domain-containing protein [Paraflavisolibacter caeni]
MQTKQTINIIGATGNMGSAISQNLSKGNYRLLLYARDQEKIEPIVNEIKNANPAADVEAIDSNYNGCWEADIIIVAVPYGAQNEVAEKIREVANQKIVISIANPLNETHTGLATAPDTSAAEELQKLLPNSKVIKAFNTTFAADFSMPVIDGKQVDAFIAGNDAEALQTVSELVSTVGFNPIIAGDLTVSRTLENMQLLLIQLGMKYNYNWLAGWKILHN